MDKRSEQRIPRNVRFFVHVHDCQDEPDMVGMSVACEAVDFSLNGLQLRTGDRLIPGTLLNITIGIGQPFAMYLLRGEIRWQRPVDDEYAMGIQLKEADGTDLSAWQSSFDDIFAA